MFLMYRNKLVVHAKRVAVNSKDLHLLRDLWFTIDPNHPFAAPSKETNQARAIGGKSQEESVKKYHLKLVRQLKDLVMRRAPLNPKLMLKLRGWDLESGRFITGEQERERRRWVVGYQVKTRRDPQIRVPLPYDRPVPPFWLEAEEADDTDEEEEEE